MIDVSTAFWTTALATAGAVVFLWVLSRRVR